jgi:small-conductance mechanosensitive channel
MRRAHRIAAWLCAAGLLAVAAHALAADEPAPAGAQTPAQTPTRGDAASELAAERSELAGEIASQRERLTEAGESPDGSGPLASDLRRLEAIDRALADALAALERSAVLAAEAATVDAELAAPPVLPGAPPFALDALDLAADQLATVRARVAALESRIGVLEEDLPRLRQSAEERERERRRLKESVDEAADDPETAALRRSVREAGLEARLLGAQARLSERLLANARAELDIERRRQQVAGRVVEAVEGQLAPLRAAREAALAELDLREGELRRAVERAQPERALAERRLTAAQKRLESGEPDAALQAELEARRLAALLAGRRSAALEDELVRLATERDLVLRRLDVLSGRLAAGRLREATRELDDAAQARARRLRYARGVVAEHRADQEAVRAKLAAAREAAAPEARYLEEQDRSLSALIALGESEAADLERVQALADRTRGALARRSQRLGVADRLRQVADRIVELWRYELYTVEDRPITLGKVALALLLFGLGSAFSQRLSRLFGAFLVRRRRLEAGVSNALESLAFYALLLFFFLFALRIVNIPLTAFTLLGGAFAIGVGFGSQSILNNFISGLILLAERPIKVGDIVAIDGTTGRVEAIGPRSTRVRTFDNTHIIVPNSSFLEKNVVNWTLSDDIIRGQVEVGVAYGSRPRDVERLVRRVLDEHGQILEDPAPQVLFTAFGENALHFRAYFWLRIRDLTDRGRIESDVRTRIEHLFREGEIALPFPQRDVHLDQRTPFEVRVVPPAEEREA